MAMNAGDIEKMIRDAFPDAIVEIRDLAGDGDHYVAKVVSSAFAGKSRVEQQRMVSEALKGKLGTELHSLSMQTSAP